MTNRPAHSTTFPVFPLLAGFCLGGVAGLLLAPDSGKAIRTQLAQQALRTQQQLASQLQGENGARLLDAALAALQKEAGNHSTLVSWLVKGAKFLLKG